MVLVGLVWYLFRVYLVDIRNFCMDVFWVGKWRYGNVGKVIEFFF